MPKIVLLPHGDTISPTGHLSYQSTLDLIKITVAIPSHLSQPTGARPRIFCGSENAPRRTAILVAEMLHSNIKICTALDETIDAAKLWTFAGRCLNSPRDVIAVSHAETIAAFITILTATNGEAYADRHTEPSAPCQFTVIDTERHNISTATAPANILA